MTDVVVVGAGLGGLAAAVTAAIEGARVTLVERGDKFGGAAAYSGGQVWLGANHVARREGSDDTVDATRAYVTALAMKEPSVFEPARLDEWIEEGRRAAKWFEDQGVVRWEVIPGYPDYYHPDVAGSQPWGRYLTGGLFDGHALGDRRDSLLEGPHFPVGITYGEQFEPGGMSRRDALAALRAERVAADLMSYGEGIVASFGAAARRAGVELLLGTDVETARRDARQRSRGAGAHGHGLQRARPRRPGPGVRAGFERVGAAVANNTAPHPNIGPVEQPPFFGMRLRLCNTGIASSGLRSTDHARVLDRQGDVIGGLYAVGECAVRNTGGGGYNSEYSLSRAMVFGWVAARHALGVDGGGH